MSGLRFETLRIANKLRAREVFKMCEAWTISDWYLALVGEVGELANLLKKVNRGEDIPKRMIEDEIADIQTYLDLLAAKLNIDLAEATINKFNEVSAKRNASTRL
jgi:NTP pyrophosphatase (non-canonical NTP hydrolase)